MFKTAINFLTKVDSIFQKKETITEEELNKMVEERVKEFINTTQDADWEQTLNNREKFRGVLEAAEEEGRHIEKADGVNNQYIYDKLLEGYKKFYPQNEVDRIKNIAGDY